MAKFLNTTGVSYHLEELIKGTKDRLILISPYLQFHNRIKDNIGNLIVQKRDVRIIYRENKLKVEESNWLEGLIGVRTSVCSTLHAKCYINEKEAIVTSMNLYSFSQQNNDEMGIYITKEQDPELYHDIAEEVQRLLTISKEIRVTVTTVDSKVVDKKTDELKKYSTKKKSSSSKLMKTKELSDKTGITSRKVNSWFVDNKLMYKKDNQWFATTKGKEQGGVEQDGYYGQEVLWPEEISDLIAKTDLPF